MARGQAQAADSALKTNNAAATTAANQGSQVLGMDMPAIQGQINPTPQTTAALTQLPVTAANSAFEAAKTNATNRMARTNNSAGYGDTIDKLAMDKAKAGSTAVLQGQNAIQNLKNEGIKNTGQLFGISQDTMAKLYGTQPGLISGRAAGGGWAQGFSDVVNSLKPGKS